MQNAFLMTEIPIAVPSDLHYEKFVFEQYLSLLRHIDNQLLQKTTLDQDMQILAVHMPHSWMFQMSILYRAEMKKIVKAQLNLINKARQMLVDLCAASEKLDLAEAPASL